jgi:hypothetical protein
LAAGQAGCRPKLIRGILSKERKEMVMNTQMGIGVFLALTLLCAANTAAQVLEEKKPINSALYYYDMELFHWSYGALGGLTLNFQNQSSSIRYTLPAPMRNALLKYPDSAKEYKTYKWKNALGNVLASGGLGFIVAGFYIPSAWRDEYLSEDGELTQRGSNLVFGFLLSGLTIEMIGSLLINGSQENLFSAVTLFNRDQMREF